MLELGFYEAEALPGIQPSLLRPLSHHRIIRNSLPVACEHLPIGIISTFSHFNFDIETMEPIEPPWQAIKDWILADERDLDWFNRPRYPSNPDPDGVDQSPM